MDEATVALLKKAFREHYFNSAKKIEFPTKMEEREFGYIPFDGTMVRHLAFVTPGQLIAELVRQAVDAVNSLTTSDAARANKALTENKLKALTVPPAIPRPR